MANRIVVTNQVIEDGHLFTEFHGYGQKMLVDKRPDGQMWVGTEPEEGYFGVDISGANLLFHPDYKDDPEFYFNFRNTIPKEYYQDAENSLHDAIAFTDELLERKEELFMIAGIDINTYKDKDYE